MRCEKRKESSFGSPTYLRSLLGTLLLDECKLSKSKVSTISSALSRVYFLESDVHIRTNIITILSQFYEQKKLTHIPKPILMQMISNNKDAYELFSLLAKHSPSLFANKIVELLDCHQLTYENQDILLDLLDKLVSTHGAELKRLHFSNLLHSTVEKFALANQPLISCEEGSLTSEKLSRKAKILARVIKYYDLNRSDSLTLVFALNQFVDRRFFRQVVDVVKNSRHSDSEKINILVGLYLYLDWYSKNYETQKKEITRLKEYIYDYLCYTHNILVFIPSKYSDAHL